MIQQQVAGGPEGSSCARSLSGEDSLGTGLPESGRPRETFRQTPSPAAFERRPEEDAPAGKWLPAAEALGQPCILLIDDDPAVALGLAKLLERHGCRVVLASNGMNALRMLDDMQIMLVITDIYMDGMDGLETIMCLRKRRPDLPVIAISGGSPKMPIDCLHMARSLGAVCVMSKPLTIAPLLEVIRQLAPELARPT